MIDGELAGHDCRAAAVAIVDDFEQVAALLRSQRCEPPIVEDQKLDTGEALEEAYIPSVATCQRKCVVSAGNALVSWTPRTASRSTARRCANQRKNPASEASLTSTTPREP